MFVGMEGPPISSFEPTAYVAMQQQIWARLRKKHRLELDVAIWKIL